MSNLDTSVNREEKYFLPEMQRIAKVSEFCDTRINSFDKSYAIISLQSMEDANTMGKLLGNISKRQYGEIENKSVLGDDTTSENLHLNYIWKFRQIQGGEPGAD